MHYYQFNIGDYARDTVGISLIEDIAYRRLIDNYHLNERPLNGCSASVARVIGMREYHDEVNYILERFFVQNDNGDWVHGRVEENIRAYRNQKTTAIKAGKASGKARRQKARERSLNERSTDGERTLNQPITNNQEPETNINGNTNVLPVDAGASPDCPHLEIIKLYHETLPELQAVIPSRWEGKRAKALRARWRESEKHRNLKFWKRFFEELRNYPFYMGENDRGWQANLGWMVERKNFDNLIEKFISGSRS